jgi:ABC-type transporter Mla MlaB component
MKKFNIHTSPIQVDGVAMEEVVMEGELTLRHASAIRTSLLKALQEYDVLRISVQHVTSIDLSCIQLLYSTMHTSAAMKKQVDLNFHLPTDLESLLMKAGFESFIKKM